MPDQSWHLVLTGLTLGLVHVLAGPDHLSALAALSVGTSYKAFLLGVRWGIGHSTGLVAVAVVFILLKGDLNLRVIGRYCDSLVGLFMIVLGVYGTMTALRVHQQKRTKRDVDLELHHITDTSSDDMTGNGSGTDSPTGDLSMRPLLRRSADWDAEAAETTDTTDTSSSWYELEHNLSEDCPLCGALDMADSSTQRILSFTIGLLHGVAGPGGILGVLPAVEMQNWRYSTLYLGSFILASTLSMGCFAAIYGEATKRIGATAETVDFGLRVLSAAMSIIVGTVWFVLALLGKLEDLFH